ncbi:MAG: MBL fold metallo-hydrolase RNA specificity domain-containing protein [Dehalococcoidia bacterium]|nr:MBL fold metallo-hydrolase RNA specificity domain-containing protein [Dehalococcoidia bacterium]
MVTLSFHGGIGCIGGNKFLLRDGEHTFFLDFGLPFSQRKGFYEEYLNPRPGAGLLDFLEMGLLPPIRGIYRGDLETVGLWKRFDSHKHYREMDSLDGVLLSHAHLDHSGYISFLQGDIPVYASALTAFVAKAMQDCAKSDVEHEVCYLTPREYSVPKSGWRLGALKGGEWNKVHSVQRPFRLADPGTASLSQEALSFWRDTPVARPMDTTPLGDMASSPLPLRSFPLDHSIPGAMAWAVETSVGWVVYTGDIRFHGSRGGLSHNFIEQAAALHPRALVAEGTYVESERLPVAEEEVYENALRAARGARGLIIADFAPRDIERLLTFRQVARNIGRRLVVLTRDAYLLEATALMEPLVPPVATDDILRIFEDSKTGPDKWEKGVFERHHGQMVSAEEISRRQTDYMVCFSFFDLNKLPSIMPQEGSVYIYSSSEPHDEEGELDVRRLNQWILRFGMRPVGVPRWTEHTVACPLGVKAECGHWAVPDEERGLHASGHATGPQLLDMVRSIRPQTFIPVHSQTPERYLELLKGTDIEVYLPSEGGVLAL